MKPLVCPRCGCSARFVVMTARVKCVLNKDGSVGQIVSAGRRVGTRVYECGGGHHWPTRMSSTREES